jgi:hypothetical protein
VSAAAPPLNVSFPFPNLCLLLLPSLRPAPYRPARFIGRPCDLPALGFLAGAKNWCSVPRVSPLARAELIVEDNERLRVNHIFDSSEPYFCSSEPYFGDVGYDVEEKLLTCWPREGGC